MFSFSDGTVVVNNSVTYSSCRSKDEENNGVSVNLTGTPYFFSDIFNKFVSVGCGSLATILRNPTDYPFGICMQPSCSNIGVTSNVGCNTEIPPGLSSFVANMTEMNPSNSSKRSCRSAFLADVSLLDTASSDNNGLNSSTNIPTAHKQGTPKFGHVPTTLQWGKPKPGKCELKNDSRTLCSRNGQYCWSNISSTHLCVCSYMYGDINDIATDVCQEGKCSNAKYEYCYMLCLNAPGNYCSSTCPDGYEYSEGLCKRPEFSRQKERKESQKWPIVIGCSASVGTAIALICTWRMRKVLKRRKSIKLKQKYFKRNGGLLLQQQMSSNEGNVEKIRLFASKELEKATDYYNVNRILGQGGQGTVYKGMLTDGSIVAIKKSKMMEEKKVDEKKQLEQFIKN
ncbi:hypothetical protein PTKIN_Ptkin09bG0246400 [Pterospermum kingtungense]